MKEIVLVFLSVLLGAQTTIVPSSGSSLSAGTAIIISGGVIRVEAASVPSYLQTTGSLTFAEIADGACGDKTIALTGAAAGDAASVGVPAAFGDGLLPAAIVKSANTVTVRVCNFSGDAATPTGTFRVWVNKLLP